MIINTEADNAKLLVRAFNANGLFSFGSGLLILFATQRLSHWFGQLEPMIFSGLGIGLILFAARLFYLAGPGKLHQLEAKIVIGSDIGWVVGSAVLASLFFSEIATVGIIIMSLISLLVGGFALFQHKGLVRYLNSISPDSANPG